MNTKDFRDIFIPEEASWTYWHPKTPSSPEGRYSTESHLLSGEITNEIIQDHLDGKKGIVLSPFCSEKEVKWAALDIDVKLPKEISDKIAKECEGHPEKLKLEIDKALKENLPSLLKKALETVNKISGELQKRDMTLDIFRSKSKGYHIYIILDEPIKANYIRIFLRDVLRTAKVSCEIFPKQDKTTDKGGSKIHLPFFGNIRKCVETDGEDTDYLKTKNITKEIVVSEEVLKSEREQKKAFRTPIKDFHLCMLKIMDGVEEHRRNICAYNLAGTYRSFMKESLIIPSMRMWNKGNKPPLGDAELLGIVKRTDLEPLTNFPKCEDPIIKLYCSPDCPKLNKEQAKTNETQLTYEPISTNPDIRRHKQKEEYYLFGQGKTPSRLTDYILGIVKHTPDSDKTTLYVCSKGKRIELNLDDTTTWRQFQKKCSHESMTVKMFGKASANAQLFDQLWIFELSRANPALKQDLKLLEEKYDGIISTIMSYVAQYTIINLNELGEDEEVLRTSCKLGWKKKDKVYLNAPAFCDKARINLEDTLLLFKQFGLNKQGVRTPYNKNKKETLWVINIEEDEDE